MSDDGDLALASNLEDVVDRGGQVLQGHLIDTEGPEPTVRVRVPAPAMGE